MYCTVPSDTPASAATARSVMAATPTLLSTVTAAAMIWSSRSAALEVNHGFLRSGTVALRPMIVIQLTYFCNVVAPRSIRRAGFIGRHTCRTPLRQLLMTKSIHHRLHILEAADWKDGVITLLDPSSPYRPWRYAFGETRPGDCALLVLGTDPVSVLTVLGRIDDKGGLDGCTFSQQYQLNLVDPDHSGDAGQRVRGIHRLASG